MCSILSLRRSQIYNHLRLAFWSPPLLSSKLSWVLNRSSFVLRSSLSLSRPYLPCSSPSLLLAPFRLASLLLFLFFPPAAGPLLRPSLSLFIHAYKGVEDYFTSFRDVGPRVLIQRQENGNFIEPYSSRPSINTKFEKEF